MDFLVVLVFTLPLFVGLVVVAVKILEFAFNRDIATAKTVAIYTTVTMLAALAVAGVGIVIWISTVLGNDPS